jgi:hypothetical protein
LVWNEKVRVTPAGANSESEPAFAPQESNPFVRHPDAFDPTCACQYKSPSQSPKENAQAIPLAAE